MPGNVTKFYEATYSGEGVENKGKYKFVLIKKASHWFGKETIETETMHQAQYNQSDKKNHLITFAVDVGCKDKLKNCIENKLKDNLFDNENPENFLASLRGEGFQFKPKDDFSYVLGEMFNTSPTLESEVDDNTLIERVEIWQNWLSELKEAGLNFDEDKKFSAELVELKNEFLANQGEGPKKSLINKLIEIDSQAMLQLHIPQRVDCLKQLQAEFVDYTSGYSAFNIELVKKFLAGLEKYSNTEIIRKNTKKLREYLRSIDVKIELYAGKLEQIIDGLNERVEVVSKQLSTLESSKLFPPSKELLKKEFLDGKIDEFREALKTKSLVELENRALFIETTFKIQLDLVKEDFVEVSKQRLETASKHVYPYYEAKSAKLILDKIAFLQSMLARISPMDVAEFGSAIESVNGCVERAGVFYNEASKKEETPKVEFRKGSSNVAQFFAEKMDVLNALKKHGENIWQVSELAHKKADILGKIFVKAVEIRDQHKKLLESPELDREKAQEMKTGITEFVQFVDENQDTLLRYRGISALKPLAKLWGGGKVTSEEYINELRDQLSECDNSTSVENLAKP